MRPPTEQIAVTWLPRPVPLIPAAVVARGKPARALARRLLDLNDPDLSTLRGVVAPGLLAVLGEASALPWADGVVYLGRVPEHPAVLWPTHSAPDLPVPLVQRALQRQFSHLPAPLAVVPSLGCVLSVAAALPLERAALREWLEMGK